MKQLLFKTLGIIALIAMPFLANAQNVTVKGIVSDESGLPMIGATVLQEGTQNGAVTDENGAYQLNVPGNAKLVYSSIGYVTQTLSVDGRTKIDVVLAVDALALDEVVVIGYGEQKKSDLTGAVAQVKGQELTKLATTDAASALQGKAAGVMIINNSGAPGQGATIRVRGVSSNGSAGLSPLLIVDGLKVDNIQYLDPSLIESMEVLKDAASAAIYGAEAGNGVVLITTKKGSEGHASISYTLKMTNQRILNTNSRMNAEEYYKFHEMQGNLSASMEDAYQKGINTNWINEVFEPSWAQQHIITAQGGNNKGHFLLNFGYVNNDGIVKGQNDTYERITGQINADYNIFKWLQVGTSASLEKWKTKSVSQQAAFSSFMNASLQLDPLTPVYCEFNELPVATQQVLSEHPEAAMKGANGRYYATTANYNDNNGNPLAQRDRSTGVSEGFNVRGNVYLNLKPVKGLVLTSRFGFRLNQSNSHNYQTPFYITSFANSKNYSLSANNNTGFYYQWENFINYTLDKNNHNFNIMGGMSFIKNSWDNISTSASSKSEWLPILKGEGPNFQTMDYVIADNATKSIGNTPNYSANLSFFARASYSYGGRYSVQANFRADAFDASKLSNKNRWGFFPSVSAGWTISNESWVKDNVSPAALTFLKIRLSWGLNGNVAVLSGYPWRNTIAYQGVYYQYGAATGDGSTTFGSAPSGLANPDLRWETSDQWDVGLDAKFLNGRLSFGFDWYRKMTKDLLVEVNNLPALGVAKSYKNAGNVLNTGVEVELGWKDTVGDFSYSISGNFSYLQNKVTYLDSSVGRIEAAQGGDSANNLNHIRKAFEVGYPVWYFRGYEYAGHTDAGEALYYNADGDKVSASDLRGGDDERYLGSAIPSFTYGVTINLEWKGIDFTLFGTGVAGNKLFDATNRDQANINQYKWYYYNSWTPTNKTAYLPDPANVSGDNNVFYSSSACMFDGSYFKIKQIQLGYTLPRQWTKKALISQLRVFASLDDFVTFTKYPGLDPETATMSQAERQGFDIGTYPITQKIVFGLNLTF